MLNYYLLGNEESVSSVRKQSSDYNNEITFHEKGKTRLWLERGCGLTFFGLALAFFLALVTYNPADPSLDVATSHPPTNLLGRFGAILADSLFQGIGGGAFIPVLILSAWGWLLVTNRFTEHETRSILIMRSVATLCLLPLLGALLAAIPLLFPVFPNVNWPSTAGIGGGIGHSIAQLAISAGIAMFGSTGGLVLWFIGIVLFILLLVLATGLSQREWFAIGSFCLVILWVPFKVIQGVIVYYRNKNQSDPITKETNIYQEQETRYSRKPTPSASTSIISQDNTSYENKEKVVTALPSLISPTSIVSSERVPSGASHHSLVIYDPNKKSANPIAHPVLTHSESLPVTSVTTSLLSVQKKPVARKGLGLFFGKPSHQEKTRVSQEHYQTGWELPPLSLLHPTPPYGHFGPSSELIHATARLLEQVLADYGVHGKIVGHSAGPVVTLYELEPAAGIRSARVIGLADDVARSLSVLSVRIATVPGRNVIGIEVPNQTRETVYLSELLSQPSWRDDPSQLLLALGKDIGGNPVFSDLARMPHLLVAGTTGSGKSVGVNAMILSLLYRLSPDECRLIMIDPKVLELSIYDGIPHLLTPVVTEPSKAVNALKWVVREMDRRYRTMAHMQVRNITGYNARAAEILTTQEMVVRRVQTGFDPETGHPIFEEQSISVEPMPYIVVVIDEMADLMMTAGKEIDACVQRLAQKARAAGIHVIMATQRPSVDVITGTIKANFPTRISFQVISKFDSRTILGEQGAEQLLGQGDMLFMQGGGRIMRVHGPFVADSEVEQVVNFLKEQGEPVYDDEVLADFSEGSGGSSGGSRGNNKVEGGENDLYREAVAIVVQEGKASTSFIQRHLSIGYNRAAKIIEQMEKEGVISPADHVGRRKVLLGTNRE